jgi:8-oxo-dGTP diphosphatase
MKKSLLTYTLCFITRGDQVLLLYRNRPPNQGKWNGVGGRIEPGESPRAACLREIQEETGYSLSVVHFAGLLTWRGFEIPSGGLYLFTADAPPGEPVASDEGRLQWQPRSFAFTSPAVVDNLHYVLPAVLGSASPLVFHFDYLQGKMVRRRTRPLPVWVDVDVQYPRT